MKRCIINVAVSNWYPNGQLRLHKSLLEQNFKSDFIGWINTWPPNSPPHKSLPYGFKSYAFQEAIRQGYETILWLDASCWAIRPLEPLFDAIEAEGHVFSHEGAFAGNWLKDEAYATLNTTREQAMTIPVLGGMFMGVCLQNSRSQQWLRRFIEVCQDGKTLPGHFHNVNNCVSKDPRCLGHIGDQTVASIIAFQLGMALSSPPRWRDWAKPNPDPATIILACGM